MLLTGTFPRVIDDKGRVALPKQLRDCLIGSAAADATAPLALYVAPGLDESLALYPEAVLVQLAERLAQAAPNSREVRDYSRLFYAQAVRAELDKQGRIRLPQELVELARLQKEAVLIGVQDHLELWNRQRWQEYLAEKSSQYDQIAEAAFSGEAVARDAHEVLPAPRVPR